MTWELANPLVKPQLQYWIELYDGLQLSTQQSIWDIRGIKAIKLPSVPGSRKRCQHWLLENQGEDAKKKTMKNTLGKTVYCCEKCSEPLCTKHFSKICPTCRWTSELFTLFWLIFGYLHIVSGFVAVICLLSWSFCLFAWIMFLPINNSVPSKINE